MLAAGGNINIREPKQAQSTALMEAVRHNHTAIVKVLLENGALPDVADLHSRRPLTLSTSARSDVAITKLLLEYGANINLVAFDKRAPLVEAIRSNQDVKVGLLLDHGADIHITSSRDAMSPLHVAAARNAKPAIIKVLVDAGIHVDAPDGRGRTPLQVAAMHSSTRAVRWLLDCGATANFENASPDSKGWTALFYAVKSKNARVDNKTIIKTLLLHGAKIDTTNFAKETPLLHAVSQGATKQAQILLEYGASITAKNASQETILHLAVSSWTWRPDMIRWLVERGAEVNKAGGKRSETPIFYAIRCGLGLESIRNLVSLGADVNFKNKTGLTPLSLASSMCSTELVKLLLDSGAFVNSRDMQGKSPLHHIVEAKFGAASEVLEIVSLFVQCGADVNSRDSSGYTPLHRAVSKEWTWETAGELIKAGADRCAMSYDGKYPYDMVKAGPWAETQRLFLRHYPV